MNQKSSGPKGYDCVAFKDEAQAQMQEETQGLSHQEEAAWFRERVANGPFKDLLARIEEARRRAKDSAAA